MAAVAASDDSGRASSDEPGRKTNCLAEVRPKSQFVISVFRKMGHISYQYLSVVQLFYCPLQVAMKWGPDEVSQWLESVGLPMYCHAFKEHEISGTELLSLERRDFKDVGVTKVLRTLRPLAIH